MARAKNRGITGEPFREVWMSEQEVAERNERDKDIPKKFRFDIEPRWVSIGIAPTEKQLDEQRFSGSA